MNSEALSLQTHRSGAPIAFCIAGVCLGTLVFVDQPRSAFPWALAALLGWSVLRRPFVGIPVMILLGMGGELQHFASGVSVAKGVIALLAIALMGRLLLGCFSFQITGLMIPLVTFTLIFCALEARYIGDGLEPASLLTFLGYPLCFLFVLNLVKTEQQVSWIVGAVGFGAAAAALATFLNYFEGYSLLYALRGIEPADTSIVTGDWMRANGLMQGSNVQAYPFLVAAPLLFAVVLFTSRRWIKVASLGAVAACVLGLVITFSRGGYIGFVAGLVWLGFALPAKRAWRLLAIGVLLILMTLLVVPSNVLLGRFATIPEQIGGHSDRLVHYELAFESLVQNPLFGGGQKAFASSLARRAGGETEIPHSNVLMVAVDSGLFGLGTLVWFLVRYVRFVRTGLASMLWSPLKYYATGCCAGLVAFAVQGFFAPNMGWSVLWTLGAIPPACILIHRNAEQTSAEKQAMQSDSRQG